MPKKFEPITATAAVDIKAAEGDGNLPTFSSKIYNGGALQVSRWDYPVVVDLKGMKVAKSVIANLAHDSSQRVGHVTDVSNDGKTVSVDGVFSATGQSAKEVLADGKNGFPWQASIEALPTKQPDFVGDGETVEVNGQKFTGPIQVVRASKLYGFAFVPRGADENTSVKIAASAAQPLETKKMDENLKKWIEAQGFVAEDLNDKQIAALGKMHAAEIHAAAKGSDGASVTVIEAQKFDLDAIKDASSEHAAEIEAALAVAEDRVTDKKKFAEIKAEAAKGIRAIKAKAIGEKWTAAKFEVEAVKAASDIRVKLVQAERPSGPAIHASVHDAGATVIEAALAQAVNLPKIEDNYDEKTLEAAHKAFRGRLGLQQAVILAASANGMHFAPGERLNSGNLREALEFGYGKGRAIHAAMTVSLSGILSNVANKELAAGYMMGDQTWRKIAKVRSSRDFKQSTIYRLLDNMEFQQIGQDGKIKTGQIGEESYTAQAKTYARMGSISREDFINDDLGAFDDLRTRLGMGAARAFNKVFWTEFMSDASTFWTTSRTNYISGSTTNLGLDGVGLTAGAKAFLERRAPKVGDQTQGDLVEGEASILLVPPALKSNADTLYAARNIANVKGSDGNIHAGKYEPVCSRWLGDSTITGYSDTAWYLLGDPNLLAAIVVTFLDGVQNPTIESADADFDTLGIQMRGYWDFGCDQAEYLAGVKSKGAA